MFSNTITIPVVHPLAQQSVLVVSGKCRKIEHIMFHGPLLFSMVYMVNNSADNVTIPFWGLLCLDRGVVGICVFVETQWKSKYTKELHCDTVHEIP